MPPELMPPIVITDEDRAWARGKFDGKDREQRNAILLGWLVADTKLAGINIPPKNSELRKSMALVEVYEELDRVRILDDVRSANGVKP